MNETAALDTLDLMRSLLKSWGEGTLPLPGYEGNDIGPDIAARRHEDHFCRVCGEQARVHFVADTDVGQRWLDLCPLHAHLVGRANRRPPTLAEVHALINPDAPPRPELDEIERLIEGGDS